MSGSTHRSGLAQNRFLNEGGVFAQPLAAKYDSGELSPDYVYNEYPKMLRISQGVQEIPGSTETIKGTVLTWTERREVFQEIVVNSEEEEDRVLSGGKTSDQIELDRQELIVRCRAQGVKVDPSWTSVRLRRELGETMDAAPGDEMGALQEKLARLQAMADMKAKIAALEAQLSAPADDVDELRAELLTLGVRADGRWSATRLRAEIDQARVGAAA